MMVRGEGRATETSFKIRGCEIISRKASLDFDNYISLQLSHVSCHRKAKNRETIEETY